MADIASLAVRSKKRDLRARGICVVNMVVFVTAGKQHLDGHAGAQPHSLQSLIAFLCVSSQAFDDSLTAELNTMWLVFGAILGMQHRSTLAHFPPFFLHTKLVGVKEAGC